jgi:hypothetical protein
MCEIKYTLGPERLVPIGGTPGLYMRISDDLRKSVVFFGYPDTRPGRGGIDCIGTGFLLRYAGIGYLVTAKHLSHGLGSDPFLIRVNKCDGSSVNLRADQIPWLEHPDPSVDVSAIPMHLGTGSPFDAIYINGDAMMANAEQLKAENVGVGTETYTVGLFRLLSGERRNMPVCHFGEVALMPSDEKIPVADWTDVDGKRRIFVDGYLVEAQSLGGLSGSPVFYRPEETLDLSGVFNVIPSAARRPTDKPQVAVPRSQLRLLGLWQGAWDAPPDEVRAAQQGLSDDARVGVGMGIVVPCERISELLEMPEVKKQREAISKELEADRAAAKTQSARPTSSVAVASETNPNAREDFNSLVAAAMRKQKPAGQT